MKTVEPLTRARTVSFWSQGGRSLRFGNDALWELKVVETVGDLSLLGLG